MANVDEDMVADPNYNPEEEVAEGNWKIVDLPEVGAKTGEEDEDEVFKARAKLYRWREQQWKERGIGDLRILRGKDTGKLRCVMRQEQTMKVRCNFFVHGQDLCKLEKLKTAEKSWFWTCADFSEEKLALERYCARFKTDEDYNAFEKHFNAALETNTKLWTAKSGDKKKDEGEAKKEDKDVKEKKEDHKKEGEEKKEEEKKPEQKTETA